MAVGADAALGIKSEPVTSNEPVIRCVSVEILPTVIPVEATVSSAVPEGPTVSDPVMLESPCEKNPFLITNSLGILYLFPIQD